MEMQVSWIIIFALAVATYALHRSNRNSAAIQRIEKEQSKVVNMTWPEFTEKLDEERVKAELGRFFNTESNEEDETRL
jgi:hypothetical protein